MDFINSTNCTQYVVNVAMINNNSLQGLWKLPFVGIVILTDGFCTV